MRVGSSATRNHGALGWIRVAVAIRGGSAQADSAKAVNTGRAGWNFERTRSAAPTKKSIITRPFATARSSGLKLLLIGADDALD